MARAPEKWATASPTAWRTPAAEERKRAFFFTGSNGWKLRELVHVREPGRRTDPGFLSPLECQGALAQTQRYDRCGEHQARRPPRGGGHRFGSGSCPTLEGVYAQVRQTFLKHHPGSDVTQLDKAFKVAKVAHENQRRKSGEPYFFHPLAVALSLAEWRLDAVSVAYGMLHDTVEDTLMTQEDVRKAFGEEVALIVDGLNAMSKLDFTDRTLMNAENVRKLLVAMGKDVRVLLVKLADRLHNMRTLGSMRRRSGAVSRGETLGALRAPGQPAGHGRREGRARGSGSPPSSLSATRK